MVIDPLVFFDLVIALFVVSIALTAIALSYSQMLKKFNAYQKEADELMAQVHKDGADLLENARIKAGQIIEDAIKKAAEIIGSSNNLNAQSKKILDQALDTLLKHQTSYFEKASSDFLEAYKRELDSLKQKNIEIVKNVSKDIEEDTIKEVKDFDNILQKETFAAQKIVEDKIEDEYSLAQKNVEEYKNEMLKKAEEEIYRILETVSKLTLGKSIPLAEHEQLIIEALEKAKKDGIGE
ncbi:MAG: hypothetical protein A3B44_01075 [Candidatus Levybacteria bacterium RIFCSPLOWO2_01_FULL_38_21]|nr:MAG: hypothetical protein A3B44_01075 [Candidatus Levybacteria bacterium RIFCSPLOWO2_01_FULL_38_21]